MFVTFIANTNSSNNVAFIKLLVNVRSGMIEYENFNEIHIALFLKFRSINWYTRDGQ